MGPLDYIKPFVNYAGSKTEKIAKQDPLTSPKQPNNLINLFFSEDDEDENP